NRFMSQAFGTDLSDGDLQPLSCFVRNGPRNRIFLPVRCGSGHELFGVLLHQLSGAEQGTSCIDF
ncbi:hypothetical protein CE195_12955, partial [Sodalis-like symbiont of Philaenus spumarius]